MRLKTKLKSKIIIKEKIKQTFLRYIYFTSYRRLGRKFLMLLKTNKYLQVGLYNKKNKKKGTSKFLLFKTLCKVLNSKKTNYIDYLPVSKYKKSRDDYLFLNKRKSVVSVFDLFYCNKLLSVKNIVPIFLTKMQYNLYDNNHKFLTFLNHLKFKKYHYLYLQSYNYINYNYLYYLNFYINLKSIIFYNLYNVLSSYYINLNTKNIFSIFNIFKNIKFKYLKYGIHNYTKFKNPLNLKRIKLLDKYLIKNRMFRAGKFFNKFLEYMKAFSYSIYKNNMFYNKYKYTKFDGNKNNIKLITFNRDKMERFKGWFQIYNYIKKYSYLSYNENKSKLIKHFMKKYHYFYFFIVRFFHKIINNLKFMFIEKFNFKKIQFFKILIFYLFYNKWFRFKHFMRLVRKKKINRWKLRRIVRFKQLPYLSFLLRIKSRVLNSKLVARSKLRRIIKKRKRLNFYKYKNSVRVVNWLLKFRRFKNLKNPFRKSFRRFRRRKNINFKNMKDNKFIKLNRINKFKQLSNFNKGKGKNFVVNFNYKNKKSVPVIKKPNVKRF
jgi:hypothetical protein